MKCVMNYVYLICLNCYLLVFHDQQLSHKTTAFMQYLVLYLGHMYYSVYYCNVHSLYVYFQFTSPEEESFLVRFYDSDIEEPSSMERLYVCLSDRFLEERSFGSGKVSYNI